MVALAVLSEQWSDDFCQLVILQKETVVSELRGDLVIFSSRDGLCDELLFLHRE